MKITLFTSNQPRHIHLARMFSKICSELFVVSECNTVFPGQVDDFFRKSTIMQEYFSHVLSAEKKIFGNIGFSASNVRTLAIKSGDINRLRPDQLEAALGSDIYVVFGASYIKGWLIDFLVEKSALNIHMGISPYYRGSSCNFWALYDNNLSYVGATIHKLSKGLDSGPMLFHCLPKLQESDNSFDFTMRSVAVAHHALSKHIADGTIFRISEETQDKADEIRYSRNADFTDEVAQDFLTRKIDLSTATFNYPKLKQPFWG